MLTSAPLIATPRRLLETPMFRFPVAAALLLAGACAFAQPADRIWSGGPILTMNNAAMRAEAIAEQGGRIIAVGSSAEVMRLRGADTRLIDLNRSALQITVTVY
jgi:hypothetical protein